ncbi:discoidin domain-containing protein [Actinomadura barringtoniae]|uniref:Discoidin domain-containing protein n=1 Tax=Actinomadura barringtoniae TaxID=1427535 RepID=A0A939PMD5_9ACTN|nr:discoidin domain-containing protein [Actinomadura barringtoniae]
MLNARADAEVLLSDHRPATASSEAGPGSVAGSAVDGDPWTGWRSERRGRYQWIAVDLGAISTVSRVSLRGSRECARA